MDELTELQSARRIASASDQRRRRMERAMHDGVQQHLALVALNVSLLREQIRKNPEQAEALCTELTESLRSAQRELRTLAHWVYPAVLENEGLVAALADSVDRQPLLVEVKDTGVSRHTREIETTVYFCCLEALDNVERYAGGATATVTLSEQDGHLSFEVRDEGFGFDPEDIEQRGGLQHVADRLAAMGGRLELTSAPGQGVTVHGTLPVDSDH